MVKIRPTSAEEVAELRRIHLASLAAPVDGMWETFIASAAHWAVFSSEERAGYFCVNEEGRILQLHLAEAFEKDAPEIFTEIIRRAEVRGAIVSTADSFLLGLCLDAQAQVRVHTHLYRSYESPEPRLSGFEKLEFRNVEAAECAAVVDFQRGCLDQDLGDWLSGYSKNLVDRGELYALRSDGEILATGEARVSDTQPPYVDLGVIVSRRARGKGIAPHVLWRLKKLCRGRGLEPICSTTIENEAAQRAIRKAGFVSRHRLLEIGF